MNIFKKRPLSLILCIMLGGFSLFVSSSSITRIVAICIGTISFLIYTVISVLNRGRNAIVAVCCAAFTISVLLAQTFSSRFTPNDFLDKVTQIEGTVKDVSRGTYTTSLELKSSSINGKSARYTILVSGDKQELAQITEGDVISVSGTLVEFSATEDGFDQRSYYFSRGFSASMNEVSGVNITKSNDNFEKSILDRIRDAITAKLRLQTNSHTGGFLSALIMGDKSYLDANTSLNYSLIGISHILALSGMHLVLLSEAIRRILSAFKLNKKIILLVSTTFCLFYMAITGFSASVVRSAVMLTITNGLFLLTGANDSYTTLPLSVVLILFVQPYAVYDISLWLSAFATLGVLIFGELESKKSKKPNKVYISVVSWIWQSILATILAVGASYLIILNYFDTHSLFAPITTLIFSVPINFLIFAGIAILLFTPFIPLGTPVIYITDAINEAAEYVASIQWANYYMDYTAVKVLIVAFSILFYAMLICKIERIRVMVALVAALFVASSVVGVALTQSDRYTNEFTYTSDRYSDSVMLRFDGKVTFVRNGRFGSSAAYDDISKFKERHITSVDSLIITAYRSGLTTYAQTFFGKLKTGTLYLPAPTSDEELIMAESVAKMLMTYGTNLKFYEREAPIDFGEFKFFPLINEAFSDGDVPDCLFSIKYGEDFYTYLSKGMPQYNQSYSQLVAYSSDYLIFGSHGDTLSATYTFPLASKSIEGIFYSTHIPLSDLSMEYYKEKEVPITGIDTSYSFIR